MSDDPEEKVIDEPLSRPHVVPWPTDEQTKAAFERYTLAAGKVSHAWNYLCEKLGQLFVVVTGADRLIALSIWYSTASDRAQRKMLVAAANATPDANWRAVPEKTESPKIPPRQGRSAMVAQTGG